MPALERKGGRPPLAALMALMVLASVTSAADTLGTSASFGSGSYSQSLTYSKDSHWVDYTLNRAELGATTGTSSDTYNLTHSVMAGTSDGTDWRRGISASYSSTAAENLSSIGLNGFLSYRFNAKGEEDSESHSPSSPPGIPLTLRGGLGVHRYVQTFQGPTSSRRGSRRRLANPGSGSESVVQTSTSFSAAYAVLDRLEATVSYTRYFYNRNISRFMAVLDDPRAIAVGASQFASTLAGFSRDEWEVSTSLELASDASLSFGISLARNEESGQPTRGVSAEFSKPFGALTPSLSCERVATSGSAQNIYGFGLIYGF